MSGSYFMLKFLKNIQVQKQRKLHQNQNALDSPDNDIKIVRTGKKCRVCLKEGTKPIFTSDSNSDIAEAIRTFGGIEVSENDDYPKYLCPACHNFLQNALDFRKSAQETDTLLRRTTVLDSEEESDAVNDGDVDDTFEPVILEQKRSSYPCNLCNLNFKSYDELLSHKNSRTHKKVRIQCPLCFRLLTAQLYKKHLLRHQSASHLVCDTCGKLYRKDNLVRHLQLHSFELPFECKVCPYRGRFLESLKIHMRTHTGDKPFSCDKCELRFLTRSNLNRHLLTHKKERPFKCPECGRGFYTQRDMDIHFQSDHAGLKDFGCRVCGNKYGTRKALMRHELRVHKRDKMTKGRLPLYLQAEYQKQDEAVD